MATRFARGILVGKMVVGVHTSDTHRFSAIGSTPSKGSGPVATSFPFIPLTYHATPEPSTSLPPREGERRGFHTRTLARQRSLRRRLETDDEGYSLEAHEANRPVIMVAIEPRAYSHAIGTAIGLSRPRLDVRIIEPEDLGEETSRLRPNLVLCSQPDRRARGGAPWVELYLYAEAPARVRIRAHGRCSVMEDADLSDLLSIVDGGCLP